MVDRVGERGQADLVENHGGPRGFAGINWGAQKSADGNLPNGMREEAAPRVNWKVRLRAGAESGEHRLKEHRLEAPED